MTPCPKLLGRLAQRLSQADQRRPQAVWVEVRQAGRLVRFPWEVVKMEAGGIEPLRERRVETRQRARQTAGIKGFRHFRREEARRQKAAEIGRRMGKNRDRHGASNGPTDSSPRRPSARRRRGVEQHDAHRRHRRRTRHLAEARRRFTVTSSPPQSPVGSNHPTPTASIGSRSSTST